MKKGIIVIFLIFLTGFLFSQKEYHKAKIYYNSSKDLILLANQGVAIDHGTHKKDFFIESDFSQNELNIAKSLGLKCEITIPNVSEYYQNQNNIKSLNKNSSCSQPFYASTPVNYNNGSMGGFLTYSELLQELDDMAALYPNIISVKQSVSSFSTAEGRPVYWVKISDNPTIDEAEPEMLYTALHHAREPGSLQQTIFYMWYLLENYGTNEEVKAIVNNTELYFIPCVNPDGYIYNETTNPNGGGLWRKNRRDNLDGEFGVDLNRNYNYQWGGAGTSPDTDSDIYRGTNAFSEVETQAVKWFCEQHDFKIAINSHSYSNLLLYPFGYAVGQISLDDPIFKSFSGVMVEKNGYVNQISAALYAATGDSDDWMYDETSTHNKILAMTPEVGTSFWTAPNDIIPLCQNMVYHNLMAANFITNYARTKDEMPFTLTENNGHLKYKIQRLGLNNPGDFTVKIIPISSNIISVGGVNSHVGMTLLQTDLDSISYALSASIQEGDEIKYVIVTNNGLYDTKDTITKFFGAFQSVFAEMGDNVANWNFNGAWGSTTLYAYSPSSSITDSPNGNYSNESNTIIELANNVALSNVLAASVSFYARWDIEAGWDYAQFEVSTDDGANWIPQCGKFTRLGSVNQAEGEPLYDGFQNAWVKEEVNLSDYIGQTIKTRFQLVTDQGVTKDGFYFDDFKINIISVNNIIENTPENNYYLSQNIPNPSNDKTTIYYEFNNFSNDFILVDQVGKVIKKERLINKKGEISFSTSDLDSGVYFYYITNGLTTSKSFKMLVLN